MWGPVPKLQEHYQPEVWQIVFDISAEWIIFATIHGKSPGDGICGSLKRHAAKCSAMLKLCEDMSAIRFFDISEDTMEGLRISWEKVLKRPCSARYKRIATTFCPCGPPRLQTRHWRWVLCGHLWLWYTRNNRGRGHHYIICCKHLWLFLVVWPHGKGMKEARKLSLSTHTDLEIHFTGLRVMITAKF